MPSFAGRIPEDELGRIVDYIKAYPGSGKSAEAAR